MQHTGAKKSQVFKETEWFHFCFNKLAKVNNSLNANSYVREEGSAVYLPTVSVLLKS